MANISKQKRDLMLDFINKLKIKHKTDDQCLAALNEIQNKLTDKKYGLIWEEHSENVDQEMKTKIPVFSVDRTKTIKNSNSEECDFLLEGDNLHSLTLLKKTHKGKIDIIYIDPPYNTGKVTREGGFVYNDNFVGEEDVFIHSKWLSFMKRRLLIANELLKKDGVIFISIGDDEQANLKLLCDDVFGANNFIETYIWESTFRPDNSSPILRRNAEFVLCYAKNKKLIKYFNGDISESSGMPSLTKGKEKIKIISFPENYVRTLLPDGIYKKGKKDNGNQLPWELVEDAIVKNGIFITPLVLKGHSYWATQEKIQSEKEDGTEIWIKSEAFVPYYKKNKQSINRPTKILNKENVKDYLFANTQIQNIFNSKPFNNPKPTTLIKYLINFIDKPNALILDFFAGSGTTGQAVLEMNSESENSNKHFILCTNNENKLCENVTYPRLKTVITGERNDKTKYSEGVNSNLLYYKTDFVQKNSDSLSNELNNHIEELIQLENCRILSKDHYPIILSDSDADKLEQNITKYHVKTIYIANDVMLTSKQKTLFQQFTIKIIPDNYFDFELREQGEIF